MVGIVRWVLISFYSLFVLYYIASFLFENHAFYFKIEVGRYF